MVVVINKYLLKSNFPNGKMFLSEEFRRNPLDLKTMNNSKYRRCSCVSFFVKTYVRKS